MPKRTSTPAPVEPAHKPATIEATVQKIEAPAPVVNTAALITAERAACAAFVESMDVGSESIRNAIAKALRERK